jgi:hypothetical protein
MLRPLRWALKAIWRIEMRYVEVGTSDGVERRIQVWRFQRWEYGFVWWFVWWKSR